MGLCGKKRDHTQTCTMNNNNKDHSHPKPFPFILGLTNGRWGSLASSLSSRWLAFWLASIPLYTRLNKEFGKGYKARICMLWGSSSHPWHALGPGSPCSGEGHPWDFSPSSRLGGAVHLQQSPEGKLAEPTCREAREPTVDPLVFWSYSLV